MSDARALGTWLKQRRLAAGMTQEDLAGKSGVSVRAISNLERGRTAKPYPRSLQSLTTALGLPDSAGAEWLVRLRAGRAEDAAPEAPRQLPAAVWHFTGRRAEIGLVTGVLDALGDPSAAGGAPLVSAIDGMAGIGKTALAVHAAHQLAGHFPDGQLFLDLHGHTEGRAPREPGEALEVFLRALGVSPAQIPGDVEERAALYRQRLADGKTLIVLDNAADEAQVRPLLPGGAGCLVLITSRRRLKGLDDARSVSLEPLPAADAAALLRTVAGPGRVPADAALLPQAVELCGRLPLALRIAATLIRHRRSWALAHLVEKLREDRPRLAGFHDGERSLAAVFELSHRTLTGEQRRLLRHAGLIPGPDTDAYAAAALLDTDPTRAERLLQELVDHNLLAEPSAGRYAMHDLLRRYARGLGAETDAPAEESAAIERLLDYYRHTAVRADALVSRYARSAAAEAPAPAHAPELPDPEAAWTWLRAERANLLAVFEHAATHGEDRRTIAAAGALTTLLRTDGPWPEAAAVHRAALIAAERLGDHGAHASALTDLAEIRRLSGDFPGAAADLRAALDAARQSGDRTAQTGALIEQGYLRAQTGDLPGATDDLRAAADLSRATGDKSAQATTLTRLGEVRGLNGDFPGAARDLQAALHLFREAGDRRAQAGALTNSGYARALSGDVDGAADDLRQALDLLRELGDRRRQAEALTYLGEVRRLAGDLPGAMDDLRQALALYRAVGDRNGEAFALGSLGAVHRLTGELTAARAELLRALELFRASGARGNEAWALNHYAAVLATAGEPAQALATYRDALRLSEQTGQRDEQARALEGLGECLVRVGEVEAGAADLARAAEIFDSVAMRSDAERVRARLDECAEPTRS